MKKYVLLCIVLGIFFEINVFSQGYHENYADGQRQIRPRENHNNRPRPASRKPFPNHNLRPRPKPDVKPLPRPRPNPDLKPSPRPRPKPDVKPFPRPRPNPDLKPSPRPRPNPDVKPFPRPRPNPDLKPSPRPRPYPKHKCHPKPHPKPYPKPYPKPHHKRHRRFIYIYPRYYIYTPPYSYSSPFDPYSSSYMYEDSEIYDRDTRNMYNDEIISMNSWMTAFERIDANKNGFVSRTEFSQYDFSFYSPTFRAVLYDMMKDVWYSISRSEWRRNYYRYFN